MAKHLEQLEEQAEQEAKAKENARKARGRLLSRAEEEELAELFRLWTKGKRGAWLSVKELYITLGGKNGALSTAELERMMEASGVADSERGMDVAQFIDFFASK